MRIARFPSLKTPTTTVLELYQKKQVLIQGGASWVLNN